MDILPVTRQIFAYLLATMPLQTCRCYAAWLVVIRCVSTNMALLRSLFDPKAPSVAG